MMNVTDYTNIKTLLVKFKEKSDVLYAKASALSDYATIEWVGTQIPSVGNGTVIIKQNGTSKGSFSMNQSGGATINLTDTTYSSLSAVSGGTDKSLVTTGEKYIWNNKQAAISDLATIRSNATTAFGWGDHSKAGYITPTNNLGQIYTQTVIDASALDINTWYPVVLKLEPYGPLFHIEVTNALNANVPSWATHQNGFTCKKAWEIYGAGWGNIPPSIMRRTIYESLYAYCDVDPVRGIGQLTNSSNEVVFVRGGGKYIFVCSRGVVPTLITTSITVYNQTIAPTTTAPAEIVRNNQLTTDSITWNRLTSKPTTLAGYGITDASRIFRYTIPASGNKGVRITFTSGEPVKITVSGASQGAQLVLIGTGYGKGGFVRNNFTEVVPSTNALYTWCVSEKDARSVEIFSARVTPDVVTVESPSLVTFTAISALSTDAAYRHLLTSANYSSYALPLTGGNVTGSIRMDGDTIRPLLIRNYSSLYNGGWARSVLECRVDDKNAFAIMPFGNYTPGATNNKIQYVSLGFAGYDGLNLRISDTSLTWGNDAIYHAGNFIDGINYISPKTTLKGYGIEDWVIKYTEASPETLQTAGIYRVSTTGVIGEGYNFPYGQVLVLRGGPGSDTITQIAAPYNNSNLYFRSGTLSNFTDASHPWRTIFNSGNCNLPTVPWTCSSLTATNDVTAKTGLYGQYLEFTSIGSSAGHGGFINFHFNGNTADYTSRIIEDASGQITIKAGVLNIGTSAKGFLYLQRPSSNYIWANKAGGEICIGTADGGETSALNSGITIIGKRVYIGGTNSGSNALNVKGAIHATTGLYTDGYISAKQASTSSDRSLKTDFRSIDNALKYVLNTHYTRFRWKDDNKESIGIIAQEEQNREYGFLVQNRKEIGHLTYDYAASTALLGAAIQEEDSKVEKLRKRIIKLENELSNLKKKWQH